MPFDVLTMGRVGVDVYPLQTGVGLAEVTSFGKYLGGSPTNVAVAAARPGRQGRRAQGGLLHRSVPPRPCHRRDGRLPGGALRPGPGRRPCRVARPGAIALINANPYGNGTALFTGSGEAARRFQRRIHIGMIGVNVPVPVPMSYYSFGGWKDSLLGDSPIHGPEGIRFYTRPKVVTTRWPRTAQQATAGFDFPTSS